MKKLFILSTLIRREIKRLGNVHKLSSLIGEENAKAGESGTVARRTLNKLASNDERVSLSRKQLVALDNYLSSVGYGLDRLTLFRKKGILDCLVEMPRVAFLLGSTPRESEQRNDVSRWDTRSLAALQQQVSERVADVGLDLRGVRFQIEDVLLNFSDIDKQLTTEPWYPLLEEKECSVIAIGSPRACHASEVMLARMYGVRPFQRPMLGGPSVPFAFVWNEATNKKRVRGIRQPPAGFQSAFALRLSDLTDVDPELVERVKKGTASVFRFRGKNLPVDPTSPQFKMYAVITGQRRRDGQVHVVIGGISGPATYAAATLLPKFEGDLPNVAGEDSDVMYRLVEVTIRTESRPGLLGDIRRVERAEFVRGMWRWPERPVVVDAGEVGGDGAVSGSSEVGSPPPPTVGPKAAGRGKPTKPAKPAKASKKTKVSKRR